MGTGTGDWEGSTSANEMTEGNSAESSSSGTSDSGALTVWEVTRPSHVGGQRLVPEALGVSSNGTVYTFAVTHDDNAMLVAYDVSGQELWVKTPPVGEGFSSAAISVHGDRVALAVSAGKSDRNYEYWLYGATGDQVTHGMGGDNWAGIRVGVGLAGDTLVVAAGTRREISSETTIQTLLVVAHRVGSLTPIWRWSADDSGEGHAVLRHSNGSVLAAGSVGGNGWLGQFAANGALDWEVSFDYLGRKISLSEGPDGAVYIGIGEHVLVVDTDGNPTDEFDLGEDRSSSLSWREDVLLAVDKHGACAAYDTSGVRQWDTVHANFINDALGNWMVDDVVIFGTLDRDRLLVSRTAPPS